MSIINKQKFLAELAKLLTFMYEEDRQLALGAYTKMFDDAADEQALLQALVSPLRQAVEVARAYNAGTPNLARGSADEENEDEIFAFMDTILRIREEAFRTQPVKEEEPEPLPAEPQEPAPEEAPEEEEAGELVDENQMSLFDEAEEAAEAPAEESEEPAEEAVPEEEEFKLEISFDDKPGAQPAQAPVRSADPEPELLERSNVKTVRKPRVGLMILFVPIAAVLGLAGTILLLIPALASLLAGALCISVAAMTIISSIGAFPAIANLLVAVGAALILLAVGLVLLMLFIWFVGSAIGGLVRGLFALGRKWCYKEVPGK